MIYLLLGALGFVSFALKELADYDPGLLKKISKNSVLKSGALYYLCGIALIAAGTVMQMGTLESIGFCIAAAVFLALQIYALFGCFPSKNAYGSDRKQSVYDKGIYALCRHPGFLFFAGMYICLCFGTELPWYTAALYIALDLALVIFEDTVAFPKTVAAYDDYKKTTPFLIPNMKSVKRTFKKNI